ncbi:MAG: TVP38/TMEM64 family protein [Clostridium sp.]
MGYISKRVDNFLKKYGIHLFFCIFLIITIIVGYEYFVKYAAVLKNPQRIKEIILSYGVFSFLIYIALQILQVVFFFIPGEVVQIVGGYIYGPIVGSILSSIGIALGSAIGYFLARYLMREQVQKMIEKRDLKLFRKILTKGSNKLVIFFIYLIPGIPKDILVYLCGVSNINFLEFLIYSSLGRFPWIVTSALFGNGIEEKNYISLIIISAISIIFFVFGVVKGKDVLNKFHKMKNRD